MSDTVTSEPPAYRIWMCGVCGWLYDEAAGLPGLGFAPGTRFEDLPPDFTCPECGAGKDAFELVEV